ncbi:hypothetical protein Tco_0060541 [Tanacetum coccineum]
MLFSSAAKEDSTQQGLIISLQSFNLKNITINTRSLAGGQTTMIKALECIMDVKTSFHNGPLKEEVTLAHPEGFVDPDIQKNVLPSKEKLCTIDPTLSSKIRGGYSTLADLLLIDIDYWSRQILNIQNDLKNNASRFEMVLNRGDENLFRTSTNHQSPISLDVKEQNSTAMSQQKAEYVALSASCLLKFMLDEDHIQDRLQLQHKYRCIATLNQSIAISATRTTSRDKAHHTRYHFIKEQA